MSKPPEVMPLKEVREGLVSMVKQCARHSIAEPIQERNCKLLADKYESWIKCIDAHLATRVTVTDERVVRAVAAYDKALGDNGFGLDDAEPTCMRAALESFAASLPVAKVPEPRKSGFQDDGEFMSSEEADGWNACREALLSQGHGGVREGWKWVPVEPTLEMLCVLTESRLSGMPNQQLWKKLLAAAPADDGDGKP